MYFAWTSINGKIFSEKYDDTREGNVLSKAFYADSTVKKWRLPERHEALSLGELSKLYPL